MASRRYTSNLCRFSGWLLIVVLTMIILQIHCQELSGWTDVFTNASEWWDVCNTNEVEIDSSYHLETSKPFFGTIDGYDVGGNQSVCFLSTYDDDRLLPSSEISEPNKLLVMNQILAGETNTTNFSQLASCRGGLDFTARAKREQMGPVMLEGVHPGQNLSVFVSLDTNLVRFGDFIARPDTIQGWFRLMICSTLRIGYCQPFLDSYQWTSYYPGDTTNTPDDALTLNYVPGSLLEARPVDFQNQSHVFATKWVSEKMQKSDGCHWSTSIQMITEIPAAIVLGDYHIIVHATVLLYSNHSTNATPTTSDDNVIRLDLAEPVGIFGISESSTVAVVTASTKIYVGTVIGICGSMTLAMFIMVIVYRNNLVMTMAQSGLLAWLCAAAFTEIIFTFLYLPTKDIYCRINGLVFIPGTMVPAILVGRLWRVYTTLIVANRLGRHQHFDSDSEAQKKLAAQSQRAEEQVMKILGHIALSKLLVHGPGSSRSLHQPRGSNFRQKTTARTTVRLIFILTLPQMLIQIAVASFYDSYVIFEENEGGVIIQKCSDGQFKGLKYTGSVLLFFMYALACYVAWCSRHLPSAFNEKDQIFRAALISAVFALFLAIFVGIFDVTATNPNISSSLFVTFSLVVTILTVSSVVMPKVIRVLSGEEVVLTKVLRDINGLKPNCQSQCAATQPANQIQDGPNSNSGEVVFLKAIEPVPEELERHILRLKEVISIIEEESNQGRPLKKAEWLAFKEATLLVSNDVNRYHFEWDETSER